MNKGVKPFLVQLAWAATAWLFVVTASAQVPVPSNATPTIHGGTPINGNAIIGEIGYAALRGGFYHGTAERDFGIELSAPTFGQSELQGWGQSLGMDLRAPFRFALAHWSKATGSLKVGPYFHAGRACYDYYRGRDRGYYYRGQFYPYGTHYDRNCGTRNVGLGLNLGFVTDIALPKLFKLIVGIEQQLGMLNGKNKSVNDGDTEFAGATWLDLGLEAFWRNLFFTMIINAGAQYGSHELYWRNHALYRHMFGVGYKFR
jgi:hypothetical protein